MCVDLVFLFDFPETVDFINYGYNLDLVLGKEWRFTQKANNCTNFYSLGQLMPGGINSNITMLPTHNHQHHLRKANRLSQSQNTNRTTSNKSKDLNFDRFLTTNRIIPPAEWTFVY